MQNMLGASIKANNENLFMKAVIRNLTFDGIDSPLLHMGDDAGGMLGDMLDNQIPFDRFGWFYDVSIFSCSLSNYFIFQILLTEKQLWDIRWCLSDVLWSGWHLQCGPDQWVARKIQPQWLLLRGLPRPGGKRRRVFPPGQRQNIFEVRYFLKNHIFYDFLSVISPLIFVVQFFSTLKKRQQSRVSMASSMHLMKASGETAQPTPPIGVTTQSPIWVR